MINFVSEIGKSDKALRNLCRAACAVLSAIMLVLSSFSNTRVDSVASASDFFIFKPFYSKQTASSRDMLSDLEREMFDEIVNATPGTELFTFDNVDGEPITANDFIELESLDRLFFAILKDCPGCFWIEGMRISQIPAEATGDEIVTLKLEMPIEPEVKSTLSETISELQKAVLNENFDHCSTRYELLLAFHDFICNKISYDSSLESDECVSNAVNDRIHNVVGAMCDGRAACQGYAKAFKLFCDLHKVPCVTISNENHMWNAVLMDDGNWYYVDLFSDDIADEITYGCFLAGMFSEDPSSEDFLEFYQTHVAFDDGVTPTIEFAEDYYLPSSSTGIFTTASCESDSEKKQIKISFSDKAEPIYCNGIAAKSSPTATGDKILFGKNEYTCILFGDANSDGECDANDFSIIVNKALSEDNFVNPDSLSDKAMDYDCDGVIDVIDCSSLERISSGHYVELMN